MMRGKPRWRNTWAKRAKTSGKRNIVFLLTSLIFETHEPGGIEETRSITLGSGPRCEPSQAGDGHGLLYPHDGWRPATHGLHIHRSYRAAIERVFIPRLEIHPLRKGVYKFPEANVPVAIPVHLFPSLLFRYINNNSKLSIGLNHTIDNEKR